MRQRQRSEAALEAVAAWSRQALVGMLLAICLPGTAAWAEHAPEPTAASRTFWGQDLFVPSSQRIGEAVCLFCSAQIEGEVSGHVLVVFGNLSVTGRVDRGVTVVGGNAVFDGDARVSGATTVVGGNAVYESEDALPGDVLVLGGHSSSFGARSAVRRRLTMGPAVLWMLVCVGAVLLAGAVLSRRRRQTA